MRLGWLWLPVGAVAVGIAGCGGRAASDGSVSGAAGSGAGGALVQEAAKAAIEDLCRSARQNWSDQRFAHPEPLVWTEHFVLYGSSTETGQPQIATWEAAWQDSQNRAQTFGQVGPHPAAPHYQIQGSVAVIRLPLAECRSGGENLLIDTLVVATRHGGQWRAVAAVAGDWKLTEADRWDSANKEHRSLQAYYDRLEEVIIAEDAGGLRDLCHPLSRAIMPRDDEAEEPLVGDRDGVVLSFRLNWWTSNFQRQHHRILFAKVQGPLALALAERSQIVNGGPEKKGKCLQAFCRQQGQWKACLWLDGDWEDALLAR